MLCPTSIVPGVTTVAFAHTVFGAVGTGASASARSKVPSVTGSIVLTVTTYGTEAVVRFWRMSEAGEPGVPATLVVHDVAAQSDSTRTVGSHAGPVGVAVMVAIVLGGTSTV